MDLKTVKLNRLTLGQW